MNEIRPAFDNENFFVERPYKIIELCSFLTPILNNLHNVNFSEKFWLRVVGNYARSSVNRINYLNSEIENFEIPFQDINSWYPLTRKQVRKFRFLYFLKALYSKGSVDKFSNIVNKYDNICIGGRGKELERIGRGVFVDTISPVCMKKEKKIRKELINIAHSYKDLFKKNVLLQLPRIYVEYFGYLLKLIPEIKNPQKKVFHMEHNGSFLMKLLVAKYAEHGAKIFSYQLGGYIGEINFSLNNPLKYALLDKHLTYGWKINEKDEPFYAVRLESFKKQTEIMIKSIKYDILIYFNEVTDDKLKIRYKSLFEYLLKNLDFNKYPNIILRPRGISRKFNNRKELSFLNSPSNIIIDKGKCLPAELVVKSKLVLHWNHPSTNFLECVYVNHPVVAILTNTDPTEIVKPFYDFFLSAGVMHKDEKSMIAHINNTNINKWWTEVIKSDKYLEFKSTFARTYGSYLTSIRKTDDN